MNAPTRFEAWKKSGSREALVALLEGCQDSVYNLCLQVLRRPQDAEDAAQRVFLDLLKVISQLSSEDHFRAWLYRASLQTALNLRRSDRRRMRHENAARPGADPPLPDEVVDEIHKQIADLEDDLRNVVVEHYLERRTLEQLAAARGCSTVAVWKKVQKAREALRHSLVRAGFASGALAIAAFLESREAVAAPSGLLSPEVLAKAGEVATVAVPGATLIAGGLLMKSKVGAAVALIAVAGLSLLGIAMFRNRDARRIPGEDSAATSAKAVSKKAVTERASTPAAVEPPSAASAAVEEVVETFTTYQEFWIALHKAIARPAPERGKALRRLGIRRSDAEIEASLAGAARRRGSWMFTSRGFERLIFDWMKAEPDAAAAFLTRIPRSAEESVLIQLHPALPAWIEGNPQATLAFLKLLPAEWNLSKMTRGIELRIEMKKDPDSFVARLRTLPAGEERVEGMKIGMPGWAAKNPAEAAAWVERLPPQERSEALGSIAQVWGRTNLPAAQAWAAKYLDDHLRNPKVYSESPDVKNRTAVLQNLLIGALASDPLWAVESAMKWETGYFQPFAQVFSAWGRLDPEGAARYLSSRPPSDDLKRFNAAHYVGVEWAEKDPQAALGWIQQLPPDANYSSTLTIILQTWAGSAGAEPRDVFGKVEKLPELYREAARLGLINGWSEYDPPAAARFFSALPAERQSADSAANLASRWAYEDLDATLAWVRDLPRVENRNAALASIGEGLASTDLRKAVSVVEGISDAALRLNAIDSLVRWGAFRNPQEAAAILRKDAQAPYMTYFNVAGSFAAKDPEAGVAWAQTLPETYTEREGGFRSLGGRPVERTLQKDMIETVVFNWHRREPQAASRWLEQAPLPKATIDQILEMIRKN